MPKTKRPPTRKELRRQRLKLIKSMGLPKEAFVIREEVFPKDRVIVIEKPTKPKKYILQEMELDEPEEQIETGAEEY